MAAHDAKHETRIERTRERLLKQQEANAFADRAACLDPKTGKWLPMAEWSDEARMSLDSYEVIIANVTAGDGHQDIIHRPKWPPRQQAAESLGKRDDVAAYKEEHVLNATVRVMHEQDGRPPKTP